MNPKTYKSPLYNATMRHRAASMLSREEFLAVVKNAPLVSIDLVIVDSERRILVGKRKNDPAGGTWFVPGGRVRKSETLDKAFKRIATAELGPGEWRRKDATPLGVFEHFYDTNFTGSKDPSTHYVVIAYALEVDQTKLHKLPRKQHSEFEWVDSDEKSPDGRDTNLHKNTKAYFPFVEREFDARSLEEHQYAILNSRRDSFNSLLWQIPTLTLTGLAFVFSIILTADSDPAIVMATAVAVAMCIVGYQVMAKHRSNEVYLAKLLHAYEKHAEVASINRKTRQATWLTRRSSYNVWRGMYIFLGAAAIASAILRAVC